MMVVAVRSQGGREDEVSFTAAHTGRPLPFDSPPHLSTLFLAWAMSKSA